MLLRFPIAITRACARAVAPIQRALPLRALAAAPVARLSTVVQLSEAEFENVTSQLFDDICDGVLEAQAGADVPPPRVAVHSGRVSVHGRTSVARTASLAGLVFHRKRGAFLPVQLEIDVGDGKLVMIERKVEEQALELHVPGKGVQAFQYDAVTRDWVPSATSEEGKAEPLLGALMAEFRTEPGVGSLGI